MEINQLVADAGKLLKRAAQPEQVLLVARRAVCAACDKGEIKPEERDAFYAWCDAVALLPCTGAELPEFPLKGKE